MDKKIGYDELHLLNNLCIINEYKTKGWHKMAKHKSIVLILLMLVIPLAKTYGQEVMKGQAVSAISGKVIKVDPEGNVIHVKTDKGIILFNMAVESDLFRGHHHIASIEIEQDDPVVIDFYNSSTGKNVIVKLVDAGDEKN